MEYNKYILSEPSANGNAMPKPSPIRPQPHSQQQHQFKPQQHQQQTGATNKKPKEDQHQQLFDLIGQQQQQQSANQQQQPAGPKPIPYLPGLTKAKQPEILQRLSVATGKDDKIKSLFYIFKNTQAHFLLF